MGTDDRVAAGFGAVAPRPANEAARLRTLDAYGVVGSPRDARFEALAAEVATACEAPIATITFIDATRQWFKASIGLALQETERDIAFCAHTILEPEHALVIENTTKDPRFADNPLVLGDPRLMAYAGVPMVAPDGTVIGTVCAMDVEPRGYTPAQIATLQRVAGQVIDLLETTSAADRVAAEPQGAPVDRPGTPGMDENSGQGASDQVLALTRPLIESIGEDVEVTSVLASFCREVLETFGWWAARVAWVQGHALVSDGWSISPAAPPVLERLVSVAAPAVELEDLSVRYPDPSVVDVGMMSWLVDRDVLAAVGARYAVVLDIPVANALGARLMLLVPSGRRLDGPATRVLSTAAAVLPRVIAQDRARRELTYRVTHDMLTGLLNREGLTARYRSSAVDPRVQRAVLFIDVDGFKAVNDDLGHRAGDEVLVNIARQLAGRIRPTDTAVRLGGDEFLIVLDGIVHEEEALRVARRLLRALCGPSTIFRTQRVDLAVSIGVALWGHGTTLHEAIDAADALMYAAKELGGAAIAVEGPEGRRLIGPDETQGRDLDAVLAGAVHVRATPIGHLDGRSHGLRAEVDVEVRHPSAAELADLVLEAVAARSVEALTGPGVLMLVPGPSLWMTDGLVLQLVVSLAAALPGTPIRIVLRDQGAGGRTLDQALLIRDALGIELVVGGLGRSLLEFGLVDLVDPVAIELGQDQPSDAAASALHGPSSAQVAAMAVAARGGRSVYVPAVIAEAVAEAAAATDGGGGVELLVIDGDATTEHRREGPRRQVDGGEPATLDGTIPGEDA